MRTLAIQGLLAALVCVSLSAAVHAGNDSETETPAAPTGITAWWNNLFGGKKEPVEKSEALDKKKTEPVAKPSGPTAAERENLMRREKRDYARRLAVCDKLRALAIDKNDNDLLRRLDDIEEEAFKLYEQRTAGFQQASLDSEAPPEKPKAASGRRRMRTQTEDDQ